MKKVKDNNVTPSEVAEVAAGIEQAEVWLEEGKAAPAPIVPQKKVLS